MVQVSGTLVGKSLYIQNGKKNRN